MTMNANHRLATYGTLAPNRINNHQLDGLEGQWSKGTIQGKLEHAGWGAAHGYPGLRPEPKEDVIEVFIFESADLPDHWARLDAFEGDGYQRGTIIAMTDRGPLDVSIYFLAAS